MAKLQEIRPVLKRLSESIPWESFRPLLERGYTHERKSNGGCKRIDDPIQDVDSPAAFQPQR